jgi:tetratricopeptide (TPR) repeat protein
MLLSCSPPATLAQQPNPLSARIETRIREQEPEWTLMDAYPRPQNQEAGLFRWKQDDKEVVAWLVVQPSIANAILLFQEDGFGPIFGKSSPEKLKMGDACYVRHARGDSIVVLRRNNVLARIAGKTLAITTLVRFTYHIDAILSAGPERPKTAYEKGEAAMAEGHYEDAIEEFKKAIALGDSESNKAQHALGLAYLKLDRREEAIAAFRAAIRKSPELAEAHYDLGRVYYENGEFNTAAASFEEAIRQNPDFFDALLALGKTYQHSGIHAKSVDVLRKATLLRPDAIDAKSELGAAFILAGQPEEAVPVLREAVRLSPQSAFAYTNLGQAYRLMAKFQDALDSLQEAIRISPTDSVAYNYLGLTYQSLDRHQEALAAYTQAIALKSDYAEAHYHLGLLHLALGDRSLARKEYVILKALSSDLADVLLEKIAASKR